MSASRARPTLFSNQDAFIEYSGEYHSEYTVIKESDDGFKARRNISEIITTTETCADILPHTREMFRTIADIVASDTTEDTTEDTFIDESEEADDSKCISFGDVLVGKEKPPMMSSSPGIGLLSFFQNL